MFTVRTERSAYVLTHLGSPARRPAATDRSRPSNRSVQGIGRPLVVDFDSSTNVTSIRGSMFESAAPQRA